MAKFDFDIGTDVRCEGEVCGKLHKVVLDPHTLQVSDLIVERGFLQKKDLVVPVSVVEDAVEDHVQLTINRAELENYPKYREIEFQKPAPGWDQRYHEGQTRCWISAYGAACEEVVVPMVRQRLHEGITSGRDVVERGTPVLHLEERIARVDHVLVDPETGQITHLVVRKGLIPYYPVVPFDKITAVGEDGVSLSLTEEELRELPRYRQREDAALRSELDERLERAGVDLSAVEMDVEDGVVHLAGRVADVSAKRRLEAAARSIDGVIDVENELDTDTTVAARVTAALNADPRTDIALIDVSSRQGVVTLDGRVDDPAVGQAAEEIAARQAGVVDVTNQLEVEPDADSEALRARTFAPDLADSDQ
jgi:osmotically-inducible protein OsmY